MDRKKIGILYICTGKYVIFWKEFYESMEQYFITDAEKHYFVFTDSPEIAYEKDNPAIHRIFQKNLGWPNNTLLRFDIFLKHQDFFESMDYIFFFNANLIVKKPIAGSDFLPTHQQKLIACLHPGFYTKSPAMFTYEHRPLSAAYIALGDGEHYFAGGLNGGITSDFIQAMVEMNTAIEKDTSADIIARFHDESHWNKYLVDKPYIKMLSPSYLYPENWRLPIPEIIMIRDKQKYGGHHAMRGEKISKGKYLYLSVRRKISSLKQFFLSLFKDF